MNIINNNISHIFDYVTDTCLFYIGFSLFIYQSLIINWYIAFYSVLATLFSYLFIQPEEIDKFNNIKKKITIITLSIMAYLWHQLYFSLEITKWSIILEIIVGFVMADFFSGVFHWMGDAISEYTKFFLFVNFKLHHINPTNVYSHNFWNLVYDISMLSIIPMFFIYKVWMYSICFFILFSNITHQYSHLPKKNVPNYIKWLQDHNIILSPAAHRGHHLPPFKTNFCTLTGWCNVVDKIYLWHHLDNMVYFIKTKILLTG